MSLNLDDVYKPNTVTGIILHAVQNHRLAMECEVKLDRVAVSHWSLGDADVILN